MRAAHASGARVLLPVVVEEQAPFEFRIWFPDSRMTCGIWNILVPPDGAKCVHVSSVSPLKVQVAWDARQARISAVALQRRFSLLVRGTSDDGQVASKGLALRRSSQAQVGEEICPFRGCCIPVFTRQGASLARRQAKFSSDTAAIAEKAIVDAAHGKLIRFARHVELRGRCRVAVHAGANQGDASGRYQGIHELSFLAIVAGRIMRRGALPLRNVDEASMA